MLSTMETNSIPETPSTRRTSGRMSAFRHEYNRSEFRIRGRKFLFESGVTHWKVPIRKNKR
jgi:hypothetical protein